MNFDITQQQILADLERDSKSITPSQPNELQQPIQASMMNTKEDLRIKVKFENNLFDDKLIHVQLIYPQLFTLVPIANINPCNIPQESVDIPPEPSELQLVSIISIHSSLHSLNIHIKIQYTALGVRLII